VSLGEGPYKNVVKTVVSQARLAEPIKVLQQKDSWYEIEQSDTYTGWVSALDVVLTSKDFWEDYKNSQLVLITDPFVYIYREQLMSPQGKDACSLVGAATLGTMLKLLIQETEAYYVALPDGTEGYIPLKSGKIIPRYNEIERGTADTIIALAKQFLGLPYYWGGTTPYGYDCSGFMQTVYKMNGIHLLRDAHQQYEQGEAVESREALLPGDMVFWSTYKAGASHVGIYLGNNEYIHAGSSRGVAINSFDPTKENYSEDLDKKYLGARRVL